jgi:hypothetical protein
MKKLITHGNPFILLLLPVLFVMTMGVSYQIKQKTAQIENGVSAASYVKATSLFNKSITLFKAVCAVNKQNVW